MDLNKGEMEGQKFWQEGGQSAKKTRSVYDVYRGGGKGFFINRKITYMIIAPPEYFLFYLTLYSVT